VIEEIPARKSDYIGRWHVSRLYAVLSSRQWRRNMTL
jgi:hypothetical protein